MAMTNVDRGLGMAAGALLPGLLPTPPTSLMIVPCEVILPADFPRPGRADSVQRWDARKKSKIETSTPSASPNGSNVSSSKSAGRADSVQRWDARKKGEIETSSPSASPNGSNTSSRKSAGRAEYSVERWDAHKDKKICITRSPVCTDFSEHWSMRKKITSSSSAWSSSSRLDSNKRASSCVSSADRWDAHKKHRLTDEQENNQPQDDETAMDRVVFSGSSFVDVSPDPSLLPMPAAFFPRTMLPAPAFLAAH